MRIGIFGGTFDPVHNGHLRAAEEIGESFSLERIYFVPVLVPPHKRDKQISDAADRLAMLRFAVKGNKRFMVSNAEIERGGISYSIDTIQLMEKNFKELYYLIGVDAFAEIHTWHRFRDLFYHTNFIVMMRPSRQRKSGLAMFPASVRKNMTTLDSETFRHVSGKMVHLRFVTQLDISGTRIRESVGNGKSIRYLVPARVEKYVKDKTLYI